MTFPSNSRIWTLVRSNAANRLGLTAQQIRRATDYITRSSTLTAKMLEFEAAGGQLKYSEDGTNCFWITDKGLYLSKELFCNSAPQQHDVDVAVLIEVLAHEMSHFETYFKHGFSPSNGESCDDAATAGVRDEARAYALEYLIQCEINETAGDKVDWMKEGQLEAIRAALEGLPPDSSQAAIHAAATRGLLDWAANWTGPVTTAGGYFQVYRNHWLKEVASQPTEDVDAVKFTIDGAGNIVGVEYACAGTLIAKALSSDRADTQLA